MTENKMEKSYYIELKEFYNKNKGEFYSFQDIENAGSYEYRVFTRKIKPLKLFEQNKSAAKLVKILLEVIHNGKHCEELEEYLSSNRVIYYYESIRQTLSAVIENNDESKELLKQFVDNVILNSKNEEVVKLALIMAQVLKVDNLEEILNIFSIHNSFIFYVINDYSHMNNKNDTIFEIAKHAEYYGKFFALVHLKALTYEIENWLVEYGCTDNYPIPEIIEYSILSVDILEYLNRVKLDSHNIELFTKAFCTVLSDYGLGAINNKVDVCNKILEIINEVSGGIYSLYAVVSILYLVDGMLVDYYKENKNIQILEEFEEYKRIIELCTDIVNEPYWHDVIKDEISNAELETDVLIGCIEKTGYKLKKKEYENILKRNYCSPLLYKYGLCSGSKAIRKTAFKLGIANLPIDDMTMESKEMRLENLTYDDIDYICLYILITYSEIEDFNDDINEYKHINLRGLQCPLIELRDECIKNLNKMKNFINENDKKLIYRYIDQECIPSIKRKLKSLLKENTYSSNDNRELVIDQPEIIQIHPKDAFLLNINVLGQGAFNRIKVKNSLKENDVVYIMQNFIEENGFSTIVCTENGYAIGYISKPIDDILNNLIYAERYIYGVIKQISDDLNNISISLYLSYKDVEDGVANVLELLSRTKEQYIQ